MQALTNLPIHVLPLEEPSPSEILPCESGKDSYRWLLTDNEREHIAKMLKTKSSAIAIRGNVMNRDRAKCRGCGKSSGLDDLVHNAMYGGIHSSEFMLDVLWNGPKGPSPQHQIVCSGCGTLHEGSFGWTKSHHGWHHHG